MMQIDELRGELTSLADEMEPFTGDVRSVHRHERRRRVVFSSIAIAVVAIVGVSAIAVLRHGDDNHVRVTAGPDKEARPQEFTHIDAIVVPASPDAKAVLDASPLVTKYAPVPRADRSYDSSVSTPDNALCALQTQGGYAVDETSPGAGVQGLTVALAGQATVYDVSETYGADVEFFMNVEASSRQVESMQAALDADPDVLSVRHVSRADAYAIFKKDFASQPALIQSTKASDLPESFRIILKSDRSVPAAVQRHEHAAGVSTAITAKPQFLFNPALTPKPTHKAISPCAKP